MRVDEFLHEVVGCHSDKQVGLDDAKQGEFRSHYRVVTRSTGCATTDLSRSIRLHQLFVFRDMNLIQCMKRSISNSYRGSGAGDG